MQYPTTQQLDTRQSVYIDVYDAAHLIETLLNDVLAGPTPGLYLPNQLEPVLRADGKYSYEKPVFLQAVNEGTAPHLPPSLMLQHTTPWNYYHYEYLPVTNLEEVRMSPWDIVNANTMYETQPKHVVLAHHLAPLTSLTPSLPVVGIKIACEIIRNEIDGSRAFHKRGMRTLEDIVIPFLRSEYQGLTYEHDRFGNVVGTIHHMQSDRWLQDTLTMVFENMKPMMTPIRNQLRNNAYQMCSVRHHDASQLIIEQLGDYRIMAWEQLQADPEFQRWQASRNGSIQEENISDHCAYIATTNPYR